jgi:Zn-finger nucleic acid-binding protein
VVETESGSGSWVALMRCPRCSELELVRGAMDGFDACPRCSGVSIDGASLLTACPSVAGLERRSLEIELLGRRGQGIGACPRCARVPLEFDVLNVPIDWCASCGAVWIDGDEREALSVRDVDPDRARPRAGSAYRTDARAAGQRTARCAMCSDVLQTRHSYASERGLICRVCQSREDIENAAPPANPSAGWIAELYAWLRTIALEHSEVMRRRDPTRP